MALTDCEITLLNIGKIFGPSMLSALVAFWLFRMTTVRDRNKEESKSEKERLNRIRYLIHVANESLKMVDSQVEEFESYVKELIKDSFKPVQLSYQNKRNWELLVELTASEATFVMFTKTTFVAPLDKVDVYSQISAKSVFVDMLVSDIINGAKDYITYCSEQGRKIQSHVDGVLRIGNTLSLYLQKLNQRTDVENYFIESFKNIGADAYAQEDRGLKTFYNHFILPLEGVIQNCKTLNFSAIEQLLELMRERDKAHRGYYEMIKSWEVYLKTFEERTATLKDESAKLRVLFGMLKEPM